MPGMDLHGTRTAGDAVMARLDALAQFSAEPNALTRLYLTTEHKSAALQTQVWMQEAGMEASIDAVANVVGHYEGRVPGLPAVLLGSHIDTVRNAGKYDGCFGVIAAIQAVAALHEANERLPFAIEVIAFGDEEGVRFPVTLTGSRTIAGTVEPAALDAEDADGISVREALQRFGCNPMEIPRIPRRKDQALAYCELHIEQGPVLEAERLPFGAEIIDGWMYGRGVAVSKSDFATYAWALLALKALDRKLRGAIELHLTYDEEAGGEIGPGWLLSQGISKPDYAIGAGFSYMVVNAHNGCLHLEVDVRGRSAHAAKPYTGIDALEAATAILAALYACRRALAQRVSPTPGVGSPQLTVGLISGGINTNVVPDRVTFRLDRRLIPEELAAEAEAELRSVIETAARSGNGATADVRRILLAEPLKPLPASAILSETLCRHASRIMGETVTTGGVPLYTDARLYAAQGIPIVLYGAGPHSIEEANAHRADERLPLSDLHKATEVVALSLADLLAAK